ncbi:hypothetical protein GI374_17990 [Paracoccus sp. S-4012]|uniref:hypothetical protein n=1 Tax=Paracoccus sp. S-4012 TaxID=2665648 RepID=UPI0012AF565F|nr:hypothetical protein [Paracoccus sp. S-4012]MRX52245.1 hypothetical protein [Paracoccus sp. S-4012]
MLFHVHVGAHKTATTHLQLSLAAAQAAIRSRGIRYFGMSELRRPRDGVDAEGHPLTLARALGHDEGDAAVVFWRKRLPGLLTNGKRLVLSEENILGVMTPALLFGQAGAVYPQAAARLDRLMGFAERHPATVFLGIRHPADFVTSAYGMHLTTGAVPLLSRFLRGFPVERLSWSDLARRLLAVEGVERLVTWRHEDYAALRPALLARLIGPQAAPLVRDRAPDLPGWSQAGHRLYRRRFLLNPRADHAALARAAKAERPKGPGEPGLDLFSRRARARVDAAYAADIAALRALPRVEFLAP